MSSPQSPPYLITTTYAIQETSSGLVVINRLTGSVVATLNSASSISGLTANTVPKATSATAIGNSSITDNGVTVATTEALSAGAITGTGLTVSGLSTNNAIAKHNGSGVFADSSITDNGTTVSTTEALSVAALTATGTFTQGSAGQYVINASGLPTKQNNITLAGQGDPLIVAAPAISVGNTGAITNYLNFTPPAAAGIYRLTAFVIVTAWTTPASFQVVTSFKDSHGTTQTNAIIPVSRPIAGSYVNSVTAIAYWICGTYMYSIDNSATAITLSTTGTFTGSPVYDIGAVLEQLV